MDKSCNVSIDKLSITGHLDTTMFDVGTYLSSDHLRCRHWTSPNDLFYQHSFSFDDGTYFQYGKYQREEICRIEFNPNREDLDWENVSKLIMMMKYPKVTRVDWAVDYYGYDLSNILVEQVNKRKTIEYKARSGKRETLYLGSPRSDNFIRIYDKEKEQKRSKIDDEKEIETKKTWWRIEAVQKKFKKEKVMLLSIDENGEPFFVEREVEAEGESIFFNPFTIYLYYEGFDIEGIYNIEDLTVQEKAMILYLNMFPQEIEKLSVNTKRKYKNLVLGMSKKLFEWELQPYNLWEKEKDRLIEEIYYYLKPALRNGVIK